MFKFFFATLAFTSALIAAPAGVTAQQLVPLSSPPASATPSPAPSMTPTAAPSITPGPSQSPSATPTPAATPATPMPTPQVPSVTPLPTPLVLPPDAPPQILAIAVSDPVFHDGETVSGTVITSTNVAAVEIRLGGRAMRLPRTDFGVFEMTYTVPRVPLYLRKRYTAHIVAMNRTGMQTERDLTISLR